MYMGNKKRGGCGKWMLLEITVISDGNAKCDGWSWRFFLHPTDLFVVLPVLSAPYTISFPSSSSARSLRFTFVNIWFVSELWRTFVVLSKRRQITESSIKEGC
jgi:hypothetical protein